MKRFFYGCLILLLLAAAAVPAAVLVFSESDALPLTFILDAGHGGEDGGAVSADGVLESDLNLAVTLRTDALLGLFGFPAVLTRDSAEIPYPDSAGTTRERKRYDQQRRVALANNVPHAVLVSIHQNLYSTQGPSGAQVFYGKAGGSRRFAEQMQAALYLLGSSRRQAAPISEDIYLLREAQCPSVLIECGFLSNPAELGLLRTEVYQTKLSICIAGACVGASAELESCYGKIENDILLHGMRQ